MERTQIRRIDAPFGEVWLSAADGCLTGLTFAGEAPFERPGSAEQRVLDEAAHEATEREKGEGEQQHDVARSKPKAKSASRRAGGRSNVRNRVAHALRAMKGEGR